MRLGKIAAGLSFLLGGLAAAGEAAERPRVVQEALQFESGGKVIDVAVYRPNDEGKHPTIVYLHGGGFSFADPSMARFHAELAKRGLVVLAPHYLVNHTGWQDWQATASHAVTFAVSLPGVDPDRIGMSGISMGGQVGLSTAARDRRVKAVAEFFTAWPGSLPDEPIADLPPVLLLNGTADPIIPLDSAFELDAILKDRGMPFERRIYRGLGHGFGEGAAFEDAVLRTAAFFGGQVSASGSNPGPAKPALPIVGQPGSPGATLELSGDDALVPTSTPTGSVGPFSTKKKLRRRPVDPNPAPPRPVQGSSGVVKS